MKKILVMLLILITFDTYGFDMEEAFYDFKKDWVYEYKWHIYNIDDENFISYNKIDYAKEIGYGITEEDEMIINKIDNTLKKLYKTSGWKEKVHLLFKKLQKVNLATLDENHNIKKWKKRLHFLLYNILQISNSYYYKDNINSFHELIDSWNEGSFRLNLTFNNLIFKIIDKSYISKNSELEDIFNINSDNNEIYYKWTLIKLDLNKWFAINNIKNLGYTIDNEFLEKGEKLKKYINIYNKTEEWKKEIDETLKLIEVYINNWTIIKFNKNIQYLSYLFIEYAEYESEKNFFINQVKIIDKYSNYTNYKNVCENFINYLFNWNKAISENALINEMQWEKCYLIINQLERNYIFEWMLKESFTIYNEKEWYPYKLEISDSYSWDYFCKKTSNYEKCLWISNGKVNNTTEYYLN